jgi:hypothetical protein
MAPVRTCSTVIARLVRAIQYSGVSRRFPIGLDVLDARLRGHDDRDSRKPAFPRHPMPELCSSGSPSQDGGRREGRVPTAPAARLQTKKQAAVTTGTPNNRPSLRDGLNGCFVISPVNGLSCHRPRDARHHRVCDSANALSHGASVAAPGPHDLTVRINVVRRRRNEPRCNPMRPPRPAPRVVTIAKRPSCRGRTGRGIPQFPKKRNQNIFASRSGQG